MRASLKILIIHPDPAFSEALRAQLVSTVVIAGHLAQVGGVETLVARLRPLACLLARTLAQDAEVEGLLPALAALDPPPLLIVVGQNQPVEIARIGTLLARLANQEGKEQASYRIGELCIDTRRKEVTFHNKTVVLPPLQYGLLCELARRENQVISYRDLLRVVWDYEADEEEARGLLKVHVRQIRRKLGLGTPDQYIRTVRGFGYMLAAPDEVVIRET